MYFPPSSPFGTQTTGHGGFKILTYNGIIGRGVLRALARVGVQVDLLDAPHLAPLVGELALLALPARALLEELAHDRLRIDYADDEERN